MLNYDMSKKQVLIFIMSVLILVVFNKVFLSTFTKTNDFFTPAQTYFHSMLEL